MSDLMRIICWFADFALLLSGSVQASVVIKASSWYAVHGTLAGCPFTVGAPLEILFGCREFRDSETAGLWRQPFEQRGPARSFRPSHELKGEARSLGETS